MNNIYDTCRYRAVTAALNWPVLDLRLVAWEGVVDFNAADVGIYQIVDRALATKVAYSLPIVGKLVNAQGFCQTGPVVFATPPTGHVITFVTMVIGNLTENLSVPLLHFDTGMNLPFSTDGLDMVIQPDWLAQRGWWRA